MALIFCIHIFFYQTNEKASCLTLQWNPWLSFVLNRHKKWSECVLIVVPWIRVKQYPPPLLLSSFSCHWTERMWLVYIHMLRAPQHFFVAFSFIFLIDKERDHNNELKNLISSLLKSSLPFSLFLEPGEARCPLRPCQRPRGGRVLISSPSHCWELHVALRSLIVRL